MQRSDIIRQRLSTWPGVYLFKTKGGNLLYIWKAKNLKKRLQQYFTPSSLWKQDMVNKAHHVDLLPTQTEEDAILLETNMINEHTPMYNNLIKGHTSYVYIKIPREPFPNISLSRYKKPDQAVYIGPKVRQRDLKHTLRLLRQLLQYRSCSPRTFNEGQVCSDYFFWLCKGRCAYHAQTPASSNGWTPVMTHDEATAAYDDLIKAISNFFQGRPAQLGDLITWHLEEAIAHEHFERAAKLRDMFQSIQYLTDKQQVVLSRTTSGICVLVVQKVPRWIYTIVTLESWRIIDVITSREYQEDVEREELLQMIEREFGYALVREEENWEKLFARWSPTKKTFIKKDRQIIRTLTDGFLLEHSQQPVDAAYDATAIQALLQQLQKKYELPQLPIHIECIDISHFWGDRTVGGLSAMHRWRTDPSKYRRYRIQQSNNDDYAALAEVLVRRVQSSDSLPELFVIDGGVGQLNVASTLLREDPLFREAAKDVCFVSIGKGKARARKGKQAGNSEQLLHLGSTGQIHYHEITYDAPDQLLISLRDEAHRFANTYRKNRMSKEFKDR